jgi:hypothetical protein
MTSGSGVQLAMSSMSSSCRCRWADDDDEFAVAYLEGQVVDGAGSVRVDLGDVLKGDCGYPSSGTVLSRDRDVSHAEVTSGVEVASTRSAFSLGNARLR